ncbi:hypothetical protein V5799_019046 [Amblyomma americanum]|uniref:Uncharacterized protein n=1 Tax=Amblyomma americanum TaxID=6943 RepID=A0AAQ4EYU5_AMBAM
MVLPTPGRSRGQWRWQSPVTVARIYRRKARQPAYSFRPGSQQQAAGARWLTLCKKHFCLRARALKEARLFAAFF